MPRVKLFGERGIGQMGEERIGCQSQSLREQSAIGPGLFSGGFVKFREMAGFMTRIAGTKSRGRILCIVGRRALANEAEPVRVAMGIEQIGEQLRDLPGES